MGEQDEWRTEDGPCVVLVDERISLIEPVFVRVVLDKLERVTIETEINKTK